MACQKELMAAGKPYPRTRQECGIMGPCKKKHDNQTVIASPKVIAIVKVAT
jgi:hypothetical protein